MADKPVPFWEKPVVAVFADGGVIGGNPSPLAGTWAWCGVARDGEHVREQSGYVLPRAHPHPGHARVDTDVVTNNQTEFYAVLRAIENMADGWTGKVCTDSEVTKARYRKLLDWTGFGQPPIEGLSWSWQDRAKNALNRITVERWVHLAGHPTSYDLARGHTLRTEVIGGRTVETRVQVSRHQVWADYRCTELAHTHAERLALPDPMEDAA